MVNRYNQPAPNQEAIENISQASELAKALGNAGNTMSNVAENMAQNKGPSREEQQEIAQRVRRELATRSTEEAQQALKEIESSDSFSDEYVRQYKRALGARLGAARNQELNRVYRNSDTSSWEEDDFNQMVRQYYKSDFENKLGNDDEMIAGYLSQTHDHVKELESKFRADKVEQHQQQKTESVVQALHGRISSLRDQNYSPEDTAEAAIRQIGEDQENLKLSDEQKAQTVLAVTRSLGMSASSQEDLDTINQMLKNTEVDGVPISKHSRYANKINEIRSLSQEAFQNSLSTERIEFETTARMQAERGELDEDLFMRRAQKLGVSEARIRSTININNQALQRTSENANVRRKEAINNQNRRLALENVAAMAAQEGLHAVDNPISYKTADNEVERVSADDARDAVASVWLETHTQDMNSKIRQAMNQGDERRAQQLQREMISEQSRFFSNAGREHPEWAKQTEGVINEAMNAVARGEEIPDRFRQQMDLYRQVSYEAPSSVSNLMNLNENEQATLEAVKIMTEDMGVSLDNAVRYAMPYASGEDEAAVDTLVNSAEVDRRMFDKVGINSDNIKNPNEAAQALQQYKELAIRSGMAGPESAAQVAAKVFNNNWSNVNGHYTRTGNSETPESFSQKATLILNEWAEYNRMVRGEELPEGVNPEDLTIRSSSNPNRFMVSNGTEIFSNLGDPEEDSFTTGDLKKVQLAVRNQNDILANMGEPKNVVQEAIDAGAIESRQDLLDNPTEAIPRAVKAIENGDPLINFIRLREQATTIRKAYEEDAPRKYSELGEMPDPGGQVDDKVKQFVTEEAPADVLYSIGEIREIVDRFILDRAARAYEYIKGTKQRTIERYNRNANDDGDNANANDTTTPLAR